jgi:hypothetical protein
MSFPDSHREALMAGSLAGSRKAALARDAKHRQRQAEAAPVLEELAARNGVITALSGLGAQRALAVLKGVERSLVEYLALQA